MAVRIPKPRQLKSDAGNISREKFVRNKSKIMHKLNKTVVGESGVELGADKDVAINLIKEHYGVSVLDGGEGTITAEDVLVVRDRAGAKVTTKAITQITKDFERLLIKKGMLKTQKAFDAQLRMKIGKKEKEGAVPSTAMLVECKITKDKTDMCVFYFTKNVPLLMERMLSSCILEDKFEISFQFSNFHDKIIFKFGADRGGGDLMMMLGLANRIDGNTGFFTIPIGVVENATEDRSNLVKTIYSKERKQIIEELVNQKLHMIVIRFYEDRILYDVKCILLKFTGPAKALMSSIDCVEDNEKETFVESANFVSEARERENADQVCVEERHLNDGNLPLNIKLIHLDDECVGCRLVSRTTGDQMFSFEFDSSVLLKGGTSVEPFCYHLFGIPCEDGKMCACLYGFSTCSASYSCPCCLWNKYDDTVPRWMIEYDLPLSMQSACKDHPLRKGHNSREKCFDRFTNMNKDSAKNPTIEIKKRFYSMVYEPLLRIDDELLWVHSGDPLHLGSGMLTHLNEALLVILGQYESTNTNSFKETMLRDCLQFIEYTKTLEKSKDFLKAKTTVNRAQRAVSKAYANLEKAEEENDEHSIEDAHLKVEEAASKRDEINNRLKYNEMTRKIEGGKELKLLLEDLKKSKNKKDLNKAQFIFMRAIKTYAGDFNKNHGQLELTNARGIKALSFRQAIHDEVTRAFNNDPYIIDAMNFWLLCSDCLFEILIILKDQKKQGLEDIRRLEKLLTDYVVLWKLRMNTRDSNKNSIYWKLHVIMCCLRRFCRTSGMTGRCTSEGFEHTHYKMAQMKVMMAPIAKHCDRTQKLTQRQQVSLFRGCEAVHRFLEEKDLQAKTGTRGPYKNRGQNTKLTQDIELLVEDSDEQDNFFTTALDNLLPVELSEYYRFMQKGKVPDDWAKTFRESQGLGSMATLSSSYVS